MAGNVYSIARGPIVPTVGKPVAGGFGLIAVTAGATAEADSDPDASTSTSCSGERVVP